MLISVSTGLPVDIPYVAPDGTQYPENIEELWTADELLAIGLISAATFERNVEYTYFLYTLLTYSERAAVATTGGNDVTTARFLLSAWGNIIDLNHPITAEALDYLVTATVLTSARKDDIIAGNPA